MEKEEPAKRGYAGGLLFVLVFSRSAELRGRNDGHPPQGVLISAFTMPGRKKGHIIVMWPSCIRWRHQGDLNPS